MNNISKFEKSKNDNKIIDLDFLILFASILFGCSVSLLLLFTSGSFYFLLTCLLSIVTGIILILSLKERNNLKLISGIKNQIKITVSQLTITNLNKVLQDNFGIFLLICTYIGLLGVILGWGVPNNSHPFPYHMDEWHQLQALRSTFVMGSPNVDGAAHGTIFQFVLSGLHLIPFVATGLIDPGAINSSVDNLSLQALLFGVLRINTIINGIGVIVLLSYISKKYFRINKNLVALLLVISPSFTLLSNYYKYDIALLLWILVSFLLILRFTENYTLNRYMLACVGCAAAVAIKVSAIPMVPLLAIILLLYIKSWRIKLKFLVIGTFVFFTVLFVIGMPDIFWRWNEYSYYLLSNTSAVPEFKNVFYGKGTFLYYAVFHMFPMLFGYGFLMLSIISTISLILGKLGKNIIDRKILILLFSATGLFFWSLMSLKWQMGSNRTLVLLPFLVIICGLFVDYILKFKRHKLLVITFLASILILQTVQIIGFLQIKYSYPIQQKTSSWMINNIEKGMTIGIENIPIYQHMPDLIIKEFYFKTYGIKYKNLYNYKIISSTDSEFPNKVIISNATITEKYYINSAKKDIINKLKTQGYVKKKIVSTDLHSLKLFGDGFDFFISGLIAMPYDITVYEKK